ncbi:MAG: C40 family peptidase [Chlorobium sp.]|nr:C40 family peptidase [Chlorobium sp.]
MLLRHVFCRLRAVSGKARRMHASLFLVCFSFFLSVAVPSESFASITPNKPVAEQELEKPACSMSSFFNDVRQFFGVRYRWGGQTPDGFDCSGFVKFMYERVFSMRLPRTSIEMASIGEKVERDELRPGDLVFFNTRGKRINHVGIFIGNGTFIHASVSRGVTEDRLQQNYFAKRFVGAVRVIDNIIPDIPDFSTTSEEESNESAQHS